MCRLRVGPRRLVRRSRGQRGSHGVRDISSTTVERPPSPRRKTTAGDDEAPEPIGHVHAGWHAAPNPGSGTPSVWRYTAFDGDGAARVAGEDAGCRLGA